MFNISKRAFWVPIILAVIVTALTFIYFSAAPQKLTIAALPSVNGYDDFVAAERLLVVSANELWRDDAGLTPEYARANISSNSAAMARIRSGLSKEWRMPLQFTSNWFSNHISHELPTAKRIGRLFSLQGYLAEHEGRWSDASECYLSGIRFGSASARGGLIVDWLVGIAVQNIQLDPLENLYSKMDAPACKVAVTQLRVAATNYESFAVIVDRDKQWSERYQRPDPLRTMALRVREMISAKSVHPEAAAIARANQKYSASILRLRRLQVQFAVRAYELEHKSSPRGWSDLVPSYLPEIPIDPQTQRPLTHQFE